LVDLGERLERAAAGHADVEHQHVRLLASHDLERLRGVLSFADDDHRRVALDQQAQPCAQDCMIVGEYDANGGHTGAPGSGSSACSVVPLPTTALIVKRPPRLSTRRCSRRMPRPRPSGSRCARPLPSSSTVTWMWPSLPCTPTTTCLAPAWRQTLVRP